MKKNSKLINTTSFQNHIHLKINKSELNKNITLIRSE